MAIFSNNLKPEEEFGAFIPGAQDDDSFYLEKIGAYEGVLPDFTVEDAAISDVILEQLNPEAIAERKERKSGKKDKFGADYNPNANLAKEENEIEDFPTYDEDLSGSPVLEGAINEAPRWGDDYYNSSPEENIIEEDEELNFATQVVKENKFDDLVDDDLKKLLKFELAKSEERKLAKAQEEEELGFNEDFETQRRRELGGAYVSPFGEVASFEDHPEIMGFDAINADSPSTYGLKELNFEEENKKAEEEKPSNKKDKKKRKPMPLWQIISISAAAVIIIGLLITFGVIKFINDPTFMRFGKATPDSTKVVSKDKPKESKKTKAVEHKETPKEEHHEEKAENKDLSHETNAHHENTVPKEEVKKEEPKHTETKNENKTIKIAEPDKKIETKRTEAKNVIKPDLTERKATKKESKKSEPIAKEEKKTVKSNEKKAEKVENKKKEIIKEEKTEEEEEVKPSFAVQIYATPSKEDAEEWAKKLKQKSVKNVRIDTQLIRDIKWFKVRFGDFENKEEAKLAAIKLGFAQSWIDRVR